MQQTAGVAVLRQGDLREVYGSQGGAVVGVLHQLAGDFQTDIFLGFLSRTTNMGGEQHIVEGLQRRDKRLAIG